jgi:hypothetical protein
MYSLTRKEPTKNKQTARQIAKLKQTIDVGQTYCPCAYLFFIFTSSFCLLNMTNSFINNQCICFEARMKVTGIVNTHEYSYVPQTMSDIETIESVVHDDMLV